jgi:pimeloyl-ACP methyl ester carboxylesterase
MEGRNALGALLLNVPVLPEFMASLAAAQVVTGAMRFGWRSGSAVPPEILRHYQAAYRHPARIEAMVAYCRAVDALRRDALTKPSPATPPDESATEATLVVWGAADPVTPLALAERVRAGLGPNADLVEVPGAGHFPLEEAPDVVVPAIADFLRSSDPLPGRHGKKSTEHAGTDAADSGKVDE